ncbi:retinaldehyde-binding protein 1 [Nephila pilipes]|uniref:Retinaldehyde-binding protein 1 n=1 Tax=Nephila pilipes TaxID=299642 RepID=A0A8X6TQ52_NEPPI|nr:retinaldehyde-binding protein 1 [Nephila pilipes]
MVYLLDTCQSRLSKFFPRRKFSELHQHKTHIKMNISSKDGISEVQFLPLVFHSLTPSLRQRAEKELNESEENITTGLAKLKELITREHTSYWMDDDFLILFLRAKKFDVKKSFQQLKEYSHRRYLQKNILCSEAMIKIATSWDYRVCGILPKRDHEGRALLYFFANRFASDEIDHNLVIALIQVLLQFALSFPASQISGVCFIADGSVTSMECVRVIYRYVSIFAPTAHMFPARFKRIDCINTSVFCQLAFKLMRPFMPSKLLRRVTLHGCEKDALLKIYSPDILPEEFGGTLGPLSEVQNAWMDEFRKMVPKFVESNQYFQKAFYN